MEFYNDRIVDISFKEVENNPLLAYSDSDVALHKDIRELPISDGTMRIDMYMLVACSKGRLQSEINGVLYDISTVEILVCRPNDLIENCMVSPDFEGAILCLSKRLVMECFSESDKWLKIFHYSENTLIHVDQGGLKLFVMYGDMLNAKVDKPSPMFQKEIIVSLVKAALYELLANVDTMLSSEDVRLPMRQRDVMVKRFMELLVSNRVKPRSVSWYADKMCVTAKHLSSVCKQVTGKTAFALINEYVEMDIRHLLKKSDKSIKEVADALNFPNISFFGKYCRQHFGLSPTELRKSLRKKE